ncbi:hypothetical protein GKZ90_0000895 [Flavobacterium sp. MC2016-06]|jgi:hypothetical protein|uniref:hypothetical protein n=1 Tax=Flavobacterium sp. MC2016-06 TaxID=2676308 RepID=UPI0012BAD565|nr:hypothetical protein [Flavobacterium sp. MC2016-06]MBU3859132.1 hypothetical protein [Flavobacterium sp. MC2016-06]
MKNYTAPFTAIVCVFSFNCFAQSAQNAPANAAMGNTHLLADNKSDKDLVVKSYVVEEKITMPFGSRTTTYEVSKLDMVYTNDLGPNNTRTVTPKYGRTKGRAEATKVQSKALVDASTTIKPVNVEVVAPAEKAKYIKVNVLNTYEKVLDRGYRSLDMIKKVADKAYFEDDLTVAAKYYTELFNMTTDLEAVYYYRYAQSLKAINEMDKAEEMMKIFKSKTM